MTRRLVVAGVAVLTCAIGAAAAVGLDWLDWGQPPAAAEDDRPAATATVTRQTLVDTRTEPGTLGHGEATSVAGRLPGTVTGLAAVGSAVKRGQVLYRVDDTPVVLLYGPLPAYRELAPDVEGADVAQFEENLAKLGYTGFTVDDAYTSATAEAVEDWQEDLGLTETGRVELGRVVYAAGAVRVDAHTASVGDPAAAEELLTYTGSARVATVELDPTDARFAETGAPVTVTLPTGTTVAGTVAGARTVVNPAEGGGGEETTALAVTVSIADQKALGTLAEASVRVAFTAEERPDVLTVPVAALLALAEGGYGVEVVRGGSTTIVPVETGLFAEGRVEITGAGLAEGTRVGMPA